MLGTRHYWDAVNLHNHATMRCGLIRSYKLSQSEWASPLTEKPLKNVQVLSK